MQVITNLLALELLDALSCPIDISTNNLQGSQEPVRTHIPAYLLLFHNQIIIRPSLEVRFLVHDPQKDLKLQVRPSSLLEETKWLKMNMDGNTDHREREQKRIGKCVGSCERPELRRLRMEY
eukprot:753789-Hanusia_phi.AAC.1